MNLKIAASELLLDIENGSYSNIALNDFFGKNKLMYKEKAFITEIVYGVIRNRIFIDYVINKFAKKIKKKEIYFLTAITIYQIFYMKSDEAGSVWEAADIVKKIYGKEVAGFINAVLRNIIAEKEIITEELIKSKKFDILYSYPSWIVGMFKKEYKEEYIEAMKSYKKSSKLGVRVNLLKYSCEEFEEYIKNKNGTILKKCENHYYIESIDIVNSELFKEGKLFIQDGASFLVSKLSKVSAGDVVLDACSAPGSKTSVLAEMMNNNGRIIALDIYEHKIKLIEENCNKLGITIVEALCKDAREVCEINQEYDKIIVDAPCSGLGILRKKPEIVYNKSYEDIAKLSKLQFEILTSCAKKLKTNGILIYSTCTFTKQENIEVIKKFMNENQGYVVESAEIPDNIIYNTDEIGGVQIDYKEEYFDGFYMIKLKKVM